MADKDKNRDEEKTEAQPLTPEERIAKLEKGRLTSWIIMAVLLLLILIQGSVLALYATQGPDPRVSEISQRLDLAQEEADQLKQAYEAAQTFHDNALRLEGKLDRIITTIQLNNFSALRQLMAEQEASYQQFMAALQQGMYDISRMVKGSRTWYEVYKEDLDLVIEDSKMRAKNLAAGLVEPLKRRIVVQEEP
ncbi:MAG: hypothetical protein V7629_03990 [Motiliproteus sp.]